MRRELMVVAALAACVVAVAACGGGGGGASGAPAGSGGGARQATVKVATTKLGRILTDSSGRTLYLFEKDKGSVSSCSGACASIWPPLPAAAGVAGRGVSAADLGSVKRADGRTEATYAGHPLYTYAGDTKPGDTRGQALDQFGAEWYVLAPSGRKIDNG